MPRRWVGAVVAVGLILLLDFVFLHWHDKIDPEGRLNLLLFLLNAPAVPFLALMIAHSGPASGLGVLLGLISVGLVYGYAGYQVGMAFERDLTKQRPKLDQEL